MFISITQIFTIKVVRIAFILFVFAFSFFLLQGKIQTVDAAGFPEPFTGYAWSSNIGWISMNCSNTSSCGTVDYKVQINSGKTITGYAWSSNIGWIQFGGSLSGVPGAGGSARIDSNNNLVGWARALSNGGGWDGWISLNCSNTGDCSPSYGVNATAIPGQIAGYAWGGDVVGWVDFSRVTFAPPCNIGYSCSADTTEQISTDQWCVQTTKLCNAAAGEACYANICQVPPPPSGELIISPTQVRVGDTVDISWDVSNVLSCAVTGGTDAWVGIANAGYPTPVVSASINAQTTYTLDCKPLGFAATTTVDTVDVNLAPTFFES